MADDSDAAVDGVLGRTVRANGARVRRAFPLLAEASVVLAVRLLQAADLAPPHAVAFWSAAYVGASFPLLTGRSVRWPSLTGAALARDVTRPWGPAGRPVCRLVSGEGIYPARPRLAGPRRAARRSTAVIARGHRPPADVPPARAPAPPRGI